MKMNLILAAAMVLGFARLASANTIVACDQAYGQAVSTCAQGPNDQKKDCIAAAKVAKTQCLAGTIDNACITSCNNTYDVSAAACQELYDPLTHCASTDLFCQGIYQTNLDNCISVATSDLNTCKNNCLSQP